MKADSPVLRRLLHARVRLVIAFTATMTGEVLSRVLQHNSLPGVNTPPGMLTHWICATVVIAVALSQLYSELRSGKSAYVLFSVASIAAIAALYVMSTRETFFIPPMMMEHMGQGQLHTQRPAHSHAHMVCVATEFILIAKYFEKSSQFSVAEAIAEARLPVPETGAQAGETITVRRSEFFPVDGLITSGDTVVEESAITGGRTRVPKAVGDTVYCGSLNFDRAVEVTVTKTRNESLYFKRFSAALKSVTNGRSGLRKAVARCSTVLLRLVVIGGIGAIVIAGFPGNNGVHMVSMRIVSIALAATPAVFVLFPTMADMIGFSTLVKSGILIKSGGSAEKLAETGKIYLDKSALNYGVLQERREGADKTEELLQKLGYALTDKPEGAIAVASCSEISLEAFASSVLRVAVGGAEEMLNIDADVIITHDKITHLLKAVYIAKTIQRQLKLAFALAVFCNVLTITLAAVGILTPVYAGISAAVVTIGLLANNWCVEKCCRNITFDKLYKLAGAKK